MADNGQLFAIISDRYVLTDRDKGELTGYIKNLNIRKENWEPNSIYSIIRNYCDLSANLKTK
jgi:hypothetical protein